MDKALTVLVAEGADSGLRSRLLEMGFTVITAASQGELWRLLQACQPQIVLAELHLPGGEPHFLRRLIDRYPYLTVILCAPHGDLSLLREWIRRGAWDFLVRPVEESRIEEVMREALERVVLME